MRCVEIALVTNARNPKHPHRRLRQKQVRVGVDAHGVNVGSGRNVHLKARRAVRPLRRVHELHALQSNHVRFRVFVEFLNEFRLLGEEARPFINHGVCNDLGQASELRDGPTDAQAVARNHFFVAEIRERTENIDAVGGVDQRELEARRVVVPSVCDTAQFTRHTQTISDSRNKVNRPHGGNIVYGIGQIRRLYVDGDGVDKQHHFSGSDLNGQLNRFLSFRFLVVDGRECERLIVQQPDGK